MYYVLVFEGLRRRHVPVGYDWDGALLAFHHIAHVQRQHAIILTERQLQMLER